MVVHSSVFGTGTPLLILHGFLGMGDNWKTLGRQFAEAGYEVHLIDQRNHGRSEHSPDFSYELMAADLKAYCDHNGLQKIALLGHSMGGKTAMLFATLYPELIDHLTVADIGPKFYPEHHQTILKSLAALSGDEEALSSRGNADEFMQQYIPDFGTRQFLLKNLYWKKDKTLGLRMNLPVLTERIAEIGKALPETAQYEGKTLFLRGAKSDYIMDDDLDLIHHHFPKAQLITIAEAGHWLHAENPDDFYAAVMEFLKN
ncbi:alpha/beta fold hydrolase [Croceiramulus getboli]|nr:alpha/beta fold hydrolase [Flavobacteriaceae bacterium YJPT1-3]